MAKKSRRVLYVVLVSELERAGLRGTLDMLRYDGARVLSGTAATWLLESSSESEAYFVNGPRERWRSFGVTPIGPFSREDQAMDAVRSIA